MDEGKRVWISKSKSILEGESDVLAELQQQELAYLRTRHPGLLCWGVVPGSQVCNFTFVKFDQLCNYVDLNTERMRYWTQ